jgi:hypothetical protein
MEEVEDRLSSRHPKMKTPCKHIDTKQTSKQNPEIQENPRTNTAQMQRI